MTNTKCERCKRKTAIAFFNCILVCAECYIKLKTIERRDLDNGKTLEN
jgi:hypothetical protein